MLCPTCRAPLTAPALACANGHTFAVEDGVVRLLAPDFALRLRAFLEGFRALRAAEGKRQNDGAAYPQLPFGPLTRGDANWRLEWRLRQYDWAILQQHLYGQGPLTILDVGAWNGWLSHRLAQLGHAVTAIDYFDDELDGLGAKKFYPVDWQAIQMDVTDLSILGQTYSVVILNRCLAFTADPVGYAVHARASVAPGGWLSLTGLQFFRDSRAKQRSVASQRARLQAHGLELFTPIKGYLDFADKARLRRHGIMLRPYPQLWRANLMARIWPARPWHAFGLWRAPLIRT
jgi:SAM-dependent methyltransferase